MTLILWSVGGIVLFGMLAQFLPKLLYRVLNESPRLTTSTNRYRS